MLLVACMVRAAEPAHATSAESPGAVVGRRSNGSTAADSPSSPGASGREARSPSSGSATATTTTTTNSGDSGAAVQGQLNKLKRFLATVQQFADDIAPDIGDRVRTLVLALVVSTGTCIPQALYLQYRLSQTRYLQQYQQAVREAATICPRPLQVDL